MKKDRLVVRTAFLALVAGLLLAPAVALADRSHGRPVHGGPRGGGHHVGTGSFAPHGGGPQRFGSHQFAPHGGGPQRFGSHRFAPHRFHHRNSSPFAYGYAVSPFVTYAPPPVYYTPSVLSDPPVVYAPPVYSSPPVYSAPPAYVPSMSGVVSVAPVAPPPPTPTVIEYPTGRYELRGDGTTTAYTWVWIPNPPPAPGPPALSVAPSGYPSSEQPAPRRSQLYRWTDDEGVTHFTDRAEIVPEKYRVQTKRSPSS
jgi:Domain of unknown function (DUF4124)